MGRLTNSKRSSKFSLAELYEFFEDFKAINDGADEKFADKVSGISEFLYFIKKETQ